jgi:hypothetical protein
LRAPRSQRTGITIITTTITPRKKKASVGWKRARRAVARRTRQGLRPFDVPTRRTQVQSAHVTLFARSVTVALPQARLSCYIRAMKRIVLAAFLVMLFAVPAVAAKHKVTHPKPVHAQNPYLSHANHKAHRQHHKKI